MPKIDGYQVSDTTEEGKGLEYFMSLGYNARGATFKDAKAYGRTTFGATFLMIFRDDSYVIQEK